MPLHPPTPNQLSAIHLLDYVKQHTVKTKKKHFYKVVTPLRVYKSVATYSIACSDDVKLYPHRSLEKMKEDLTYMHKMQIDSYAKAICNLTIPVGAVIYANPWSSFKMRANRAVIDSIVRVDDEVDVYYGMSTWDKSFIYLNSELFDEKDNLDGGIIVKPQFPFSRLQDECESGISFFCELSRALNY